MKVFGTYTFWENGSQVRAIVAANSATAAGRFFGLTGRNVRDWIQESHNHNEIKVATQEPGTIFVCPLNGINFHKFAKVQP